MRRFALSAALVLAACGQPAQRSVTDAWVRLPAVPGRPGAAYFTLHGGPTDATLLDVHSDVTIRTELHETKSVGGRMSMAKLASVPIPAKGSVPFAPGGRHVMLFDINPVVKRGETMTLTFTYSDGLRIQQVARVLAAGDPAPGS